mmetsp:Transcript_31383/g.82287  ORF Transcript_31383/g.82287 Transcript_31383/m.82287 type:complete len:239 (+) Transcript_31383:1252-1968(+)
MRREDGPRSAWFRLCNRGAHWRRGRRRFLDQNILGLLLHGGRAVVGIYIASYSRGRRSRLKIGRPRRCHVGRGRGGRPAAGSAGVRRRATPRPEPQLAGQLRSHSFRQVCRDVFQRQTALCQTIDEVPCRPTVPRGRSPVQKRVELRSRLAAPCDEVARSSRARVHVQRLHWLKAECTLAFCRGGVEEPAHMAVDPWHDHSVKPPGVFDNCRHCHLCHKVTIALSHRHHDTGLRFGPH